ncbi:hypothetical protein D3C78_924060 [compost metagenome]
MKQHALLHRRQRIYVLDLTSVRAACFQPLQLLHRDAAQYDIARCQLRPLLRCTMSQQLTHMPLQQLRQPLDCLRSILLAAVADFQLQAAACDHGVQLQRVRADKLVIHRFAR